MPSLRFVYGRLGDLQITAYFKGIYFTSGTANVYFDDADNATCKSRAGLPSVAVLGLGQVGHGLPTPATGLPT